MTAAQKPRDYAAASFYVTDIIATDEIGRNEDVTAIEEAINAGVTIITTVHGLDFDDMKRPTIRKLINRGLFDRYIILGTSSGVGSVEAILESKSLKNLIEKEVMK